MFEATQSAMRKSENELHKKINDKQKNLKEYVEMQVQRNQFAMQNLQEDMKQEK